MFSNIQHHYQEKIIQYITCNQFIIKMLYTRYPRSEHVFCTTSKVHFLKDLIRIQKLINNICFVGMCIISSSAHNVVYLRFYVYTQIQVQKINKHKIVQRSLSPFITKELA